MSFDLGRGRALDDAPGLIGITPAELPALPDAAMTDPLAGRVDLRAWFTAQRRALPLELEIGCGKGTFILEATGRDPQTNYLGIEWAREFYMYTADRLRRAGRTNVRMLHADASDFLRWRVAEASFRVIHLYFSDPWPKQRHHKNRVVQDRFLREAHRTLLPGGELRIVTDHDELWAWDQEHFAKAVAAGLFEMLPFTPPEWVGEGQAIGTNYEKKMCVEKPAHACVLKKR
jgi:tRNA (guanine-N7-)-methyltransferase